VRVLSCERCHVSARGAGYDRGMQNAHDAVKSALNPGVKKREVLAWAMYDFANSGYTTVILTAVFNAYFVSVVAGGASWATLAWTSILSVSYVLVMLAGPLIGAYADANVAKKRVLLIATTACVIPTALLYFAGANMIWWVALCIIVSNFAYSIGENITASFLPELARPEAMGKVSGWGWSLGYVGGLVALGLSLYWITTAEIRGATKGEAVGGTMLITAAVYALAATVTFLVLRERGATRADGRVGIRTGTDAGATSAWSRLMATAREATRYRDLIWVFACGTLYQAGVATVVTLAAIYAQEVMGFETMDTIQLVLLVNITACVGAFSFGYAQDIIGKKAALAVTLIGWMAMVGFAWFATTRSTFWIAANLAGLCMGASQSAGRALVAYFSPPDRAAEFFGLWGVATRLAAVLGPMTYGVVSWVSGGNHRLAMLVTGVFFLLALMVLTPVNERRGYAAAR
jgi:MFS transporter, UMF1 family